MLQSPLKITVITVCLNAEKCIGETVRSVLSQNHPCLEYVIVDGGSTDGTLSVLGHFRDPRISKIISETDAGIYDAMNKGIRYSAGDIIYFLNAGDRFFDERSVTSVAKVFASHPEADMVIGRVKGTNAPIAEPEPIPSCEGVFLRPSAILINGVCHQRIFARRELFERIGTFDPCYSVCADQAWVFRAIYRKVNILFLDQEIAYYDQTGFSLRNKWRMYREGLRARFQNMPIHKFLWFLGPVFYVALRRRLMNFLRRTRLMRQSKKM